MNLKTTAPLAVAGLLGLVAAIVASQIVNQKTVIVGTGKTMEQALDLAPIVVAKHDVPPGGVLTLDDLTVARVDAKTAPSGPSVCADPALLVGRVAKIQIPRGQIVHEALLAEKGVSGGLPGVIPPGYRAMTLEINEFSGVAGLLEPGDHVDILARVTESDGKDAASAQMMTRTVVQNVQIIAVGPSLTNKSAASPDPAIAPVVPDAAAAQRPIARSVTLVVTPENAEKIDLAVSTNQARLVLRASTDNQTAAVHGATFASIRGAGGPISPPVPGSEVTTASAPHDPANDVFGPGAGQPVAAKARINTRPITIIRAGVPSQVDVEVPAKPIDATAAEPTASAAN